MHRINGKVLVFSDFHVGLKNGSASRLKIAAICLKEIVSAIKANDIKTVIFCGDYFHSRKSLELNTLDAGNKFLSILAKYAKVYLIVGNHDLFYKNVNDISSVSIFKDHSNVEVISEPTEIELNGQKSILVPWNSNLSNYKPETFDLMFGHFDISSKYLIASYIEANSVDKSKSKEDILEKMIRSDSLLNEATLSDQLESEISYVISENKKSNDLVGNFVDIVKKGGQVFAGHIHDHKEFVSKGREFIFVGSPYQQNFGEMASIDGFYILDEHNKRIFKEITSTPRYIKIYNSRVTDDFDFSVVKGNFVMRVIDKEISVDLNAKIENQISNNLPFEQELSEYTIQSKTVIEDEIDSEKIDAIKKSKLEYIKLYIDTIDPKTLSENKIKSDELFSVLEHYYNLAVEKV